MTKEGRFYVYENNRTIEIRLYWDDLTEKAQNDIREALNMDPDDNGNWDVIPIASLYVEKEE